MMLSLQRAIFGSDPKTQHSAESSTQLIAMSTHHSDDTAHQSSGGAAAGGSNHSQAQQQQPLQPDSSRRPGRTVSRRDSGRRDSSGRGTLRMMSSSAQIAASENGDEEPSRYVIFPDDPRYLYWWYLTIFFSCITGWTEMFEMSFLPLPGLAPYNDFWAIVTYFAFIVFFADIAIQFNLAYHDKKDNLLIVDHKQIAVNYLRFMFWVDFLATFPFEECILTGTGLQYTTDSVAGRYICLLKILHLARLYRLFDLFVLLEYNMTIGQIQLMLIRNYSYIIYITHWAACVLYFIAAQEGFSATSWVGRYAARFAGKSLVVRYIYSLYFSITTFTSMGDGNFYAASVAESIFIIFYLLFCILMIAFILGTVAMLVIKNDKRHKVFRDRVRNLEEYCQLNDISKELHVLMKDHLDLHFDSEQVSDDRILMFYPATIRRKVLRHLYQGPIRSCYLLSNCKPKFLDAFMLAAKLELFMPEVLIIGAGDVVNELFIVIGGEVLVQRAPHMIGGAGDDDDIGGTDQTVVDAGDHMAEVPGEVHLHEDGAEDAAEAEVAEEEGEHKAHSLGPSQPFGEVAFITQFPSPENVWSTTVSRVLVLSRLQYEALLVSFPQQMRHLLQSLQRHAEEAMKLEIMDVAMAYIMSEAQKLQVADFLVKRQAPLGDFHKVNNADPVINTLMLEGVEESLSPSQRLSLEYLKEVQKVIFQFSVRIEQRDIDDYLNAASCGKVAVVQRFLDHGLSPDSCDYDHRTALMLACRMGQEDVVKAVLNAGADPAVRDNFDTTALFEACAAGHDNIIEILLEKGVTIDMDSIALAGKMCDCVSTGNLALLKRLLRAGADPDAADYDRRCALHISAAQGNLTAVKLMVEQGKATVGYKDRWGNTAMDEALRVGAHEVEAYLKPLISEEEYVSHMIKWKEQRTQRFLRACSVGNVEGIKFMLEHNDPPTIMTGLIIASSAGHTLALQALLAWGGVASLRQELGHAMLLEAAIEGNDGALDTVLEAGFSFKEMSSPELGTQLCSTAREGDARQMQRLLRIGISPDIQNAKLETALHTSAAKDDVTMLRVLVEEGHADLSVKDSTGSTAEHVAHRVRAVHALEYLQWAATENGGQPTAEAALGRWGPGTSSAAGRDKRDKVATPPVLCEVFEKMLDDLEQK